MPILCRKNAEKATGKTGCGKRIGMARLRACMMYRVSVRMNRPVASAAAIPAQPAGREENVAAVTAQPLAALPPYGCGVPLAGSERHAGWQHAPHGFCGMRPPSLSLRGGAADVAISGRQLRFRRSLPVIQPCTARLPRPLWGLAMTIRKPLPF